MVCIWFVPGTKSMWYGPNRPKWLPGAEIPAYLTGEYAGDYGFDPVGLAADPENFARYREAEVLHGRWAMLATVGFLVPEFLAKFSGVQFAEPVWFKAGYGLFEGGIDYLGNPDLIHAQNAAIILGTQLILMGAIEAWRWNAPENKQLDRTYPSGVFDPLGFGNNEEQLAYLKVKEIKNGRLAMVSVFGYAIQAWYTGVGPLENWAAHLADPFGVNVTTVVGMFATSGAALLQGGCCLALCS